MYTLKKLSSLQLEEAYNSVFREAFPPEELKPLFVIEKMSAEGQYDVLGLFHGEERLGYICCWLDMPFVLIDYLCVDSRFRNGGLGAEILRLIRGYYPENTVFIGEAEAPTGDRDADAIILRRLAFYKRCGAETLGYDCALFGVHYKCIVWNKGRIAEEEVLRRHDGFYRRNFIPEMYASAIQLPLREGEKVFDRRDWDERPDFEIEENKL